MAGLVFDIQRCSLHDGPGIRTTVFLKGCPLRCLWCHNPESMEFAPQLAVNWENCVHCLACVAACEHGAQQVVDGRHELDRARCTVCGACVAVCEHDALRIVGEMWDVAQVMAEVERDVDYYAYSGGGITLSGGEPMAQFAFTLALLIASRERGIHTCVETSGIAPQAKYRQILPYVDLFLFDYKATDADRHKALTGVPSERILANLDFLYSEGVDIILRCPLVPGVNDTPEHLAGIAAISARYPRLAGLELMAYHDWGRDKSLQVGRATQLNDVAAAGEPIKERWLAALWELGCERAVVG